MSHTGRTIFERRKVLNVCIGVQNQTGFLFVSVNSALLIFRNTPGMTLIQNALCAGLTVIKPSLSVTNKQTNKHSTLYIGTVQTDNNN